MRIYHASIGDPCSKCGEYAYDHATPKQIKARKLRDKGRKRSGSSGPSGKSGTSKERYIIGVDGEGMDLPDGKHIYTLLSAVDETGRLVAEVENQNGLSSIECLNMLASLPKNALKFIFMGSYDWTKIIEDLHPLDIYYIMHPEARRVFTCKDCKKRWTSYLTRCPNCTGINFRSVIRLRRIHKDKYGNPINLSLDWFNGSFSVYNIRSKKRCKIWDCFKFFQTSFVKAIHAWDIGTKEQQERILAMKNKRGSFDVEKPEEIKKYCREECQLLAQMMRKLISACERADIDLKRYDGAGAIANAMMKKNKIKDFMGPSLEESSDKMHRAVMSAYFGGRFENSVIGAIEIPVYNQDIFSAYPYAISMLPCLECGKWKRVVKNILENARKSTLAVVKYRIKTIKERDDIAWMPFPFRDDKGSICFPTGSIGWTWLPELEAGLRGWENYIDILEAWIYQTDCNHNPFEWMPAYYRKRVEWGKDGPGIVMKLGCNACAGKTMQNAGDKPPFKNWIWGGMITSTTRSQGLDAINVASSPWNILAIATDGVLSTEMLSLPKAKDTGTYDLKKPLGNWGCEIHDKGVFFVKPGLYFDDAQSLMRARGVGRADFSKISKLIVNAFRDWDRKSELKIEAKSRRFYGAKSSVLMASRCDKCDKAWPGWPHKKCPVCGESGNHCATNFMKLKDTEITAYGRWDVRRIEVQFASLPKREYISKGGTFGRMRIRDMNMQESIPYMGITSPEGLAARKANEIGMEEPDWSDGEEEIVE